MSRYEQVAMIKLLIERKVDFDVLDQNNDYPLHKVCGINNKLTESKQQLEVIKLLINQGIGVKKHINKMNNTSSALQLVCGCNLKSMDKLEAIKFLIDNGAHVENDNKRGCGYQPIQIICGSNVTCQMEGGDRLEAIKLLINKGAGASIDKKNIACGHCPIHYVCGRNNNFKSNQQLEAIRLLVEKSVNLNVSDDNGWYPIDYVISDQNNLISKDQLEAIDLLLNQKIIFNNDKVRGKKRPLEYLCGPLNHMVSKDLIIAIRKLIGSNYICSQEEGLRAVDALLESEGGSKLQDMDLSEATDLILGKMYNQDYQINLPEENDEDVD
jgi:ankyrin repeat protein